MTTVLRINAPLKIQFVLFLQIVFMTGERATHSQPSTMSVTQMKAEADKSIIECKKLNAENQFESADAVCTRAVTQSIAAFGRDSEKTASAQNAHALNEHSRGRFQHAETLFRLAAATMENAKGPMDPKVAAILGNWVVLLREQGRLSEAISIGKRSLFIREQVNGPEHVDVGKSLTNLGAVYQQQKRHEEAEAAFSRATQIFEKALGMEHQYVGLSIINLANSLHDQGKYESAEYFYLRAKKIWEKTLREDSPDMIHLWYPLGILYLYNGQYESAEKMLLRAEMLSRKIFGPDHPKTAAILNSLGNVYRSMGKLAMAEAMYRQALMVNEKKRTNHYPALATVNNNLGYVIMQQGRDAEASLLLRKAQNLWRQVTDPDASIVAQNLRNLAILSLRSGRSLEAYEFIDQAAHLTEERLRLFPGETLISGVLDLERRAEESCYGLLIDRALVARFAPLALRITLLNKGRTADETALAQRALAENLKVPGLSERVAELEAYREQFSVLNLKAMASDEPSTLQPMLQELRRKIEFLDTQLGRESLVLRNAQPLKPEEIVQRVAGELPRGSVLIEVVRAQPSDYWANGATDNQRLGPAHYIALLLFPDQQTTAIDLGLADKIDDLCADLLRKLSVKGSRPEPAAQALYRQIFAPLESQLRGATLVYVAPDGALSLVPFDSLHDGHGYLIDRLEFHYLSSGRDLLRQPTPVQLSLPLILADPDFSSTAGASLGSGSGTLGLNTESLYHVAEQLKSLPGTGKEAALWRRLYPDAVILTGAAATERALRAARSPSLLVIATHGAFLEDVGGDATTTRSGARSRSALMLSELTSATALRRKRMLGHAKLNPMTASALFLSGAVGARHSQGTRDDNILTADDAKSLQLLGTQLVILSACDTARGEIKIGQGVLGLRRAFLIAGAEALVASLWRVDDQGTSELMELYYPRLLQGEPRLGALRMAMKSLKTLRPHPYYWAPFIGIGRDAPLSVVTKPAPSLN